MEMLTKSEKKTGYLLTHLSGEIEHLPGKPEKRFLVITNFNKIVGVTQTYMKKSSSRFLCLLKPGDLQKKNQVQVHLIEDKNGIINFISPGL